MVSQRSRAESHLARCGPFCARIRSITSTPRVAPIRHGVHLPQDSTAQNSMRKARHLRHIHGVVEHDDTTMAQRGTDRTERLVIQRRIELRLGKKAPSGPPTCTARIGRPDGGAAAVVVQQFAQRQTECAARSIPPCLMLPANCDGSVPRDRPDPKSRRTAAPRVENNRYRGQRNHVVDHGRHPEQTFDCGQRRFEAVPGRDCLPGSRASRFLLRRCTRPHPCRTSRSKERPLPSRSLPR